MAKITQTSDPALWGELNTKWLAEGQQGWVVLNPVHYRVVFSTADEVEFVEYSSSRALLDSRSPAVSRSASYNKLDDGR